MWTNVTKKFVITRNISCQKKHLVYRLLKKMELMCHCSSFLLPPENPNTTCSLSLKYALVVLNQSLPRFAPLLWDHGISSCTTPSSSSLEYWFMHWCMSMWLLQLKCEFVLMEVPIGCMMKCLFSSLINNLPMFAPGSYFSL